MMKGNIRNVDKIKALEEQLENRSRRVAELEQQNRGLREAQLAMDAIVYSFAQAYGEPRHEKDGTLIGWHMEIPRPDIQNVRQEQIRVTPDKEGGLWSIGVLATEKRKTIDAQKKEAKA